LDSSTLPFLLVACKCDVSQVFCKSDPVTIEQAETILCRYESHGTSSDSPRTQKKCISLMLGSIISQKMGKRLLPLFFFFDAPAGFASGCGSRTASRVPTVVIYHFPPPASPFPPGATRCLAVIISASCSARPRATFPPPVLFGLCPPQVALTAEYPNLYYHEGFPVQKENGSGV
jgi:hypothetical protein